MTNAMKYLAKQSSPFLMTLAFFLVLVIGLLDRFTGLELSFSIFYLIPVSLSAWFVSKTSGVLISLASMIAWLIADLEWAKASPHFYIPFWEATIRLAFFLIVAFLLSASKNALEREEKQAQQIQQSLLPSRIPQIKGYQISGLYQPASNIGGDYLDVLKFNETEIGFCVADVAGKGVSAALLMSNLQGAVRAIVSDLVSPQELCRRVNRLIYHNTASEIYISFFYGILDGKNKKLRYTNAGHNAPFFLHKNGVPRRLDEGGMVLGVDPDWDYAQGEVNLCSGDKVIIFTDGVTEARNPNLQEFGEERLIELLLKRRELEVAKLQRQVMQAVLAFNRGNFQDDVTLLAISVD